MTKEDIAALRARYDLTQEEFGTILGVAAITVRKWESGENPVTSRTESHIRAFVKIGAFREKK